MRTVNLKHLKLGDVFFQTRRKGYTILLDEPRPSQFFPTMTLLHVFRANGVWEWILCEQYDVVSVL